MMNLEELKNKLFQSFGKMRVYTKEPGKEPDKKRPMILSPGDTVQDVAEKILKGFERIIIFTLLILMMIAVFFILYTI